MIHSNQDAQMPEYIRETIVKRLESELSDIFEQEREAFIEKITESIDRKRDEIVSGTMLHLMSRIRFQDFGQELHVIISKEEKPRL